MKKSAPILFLLATLMLCAPLSARADETPAAQNANDAPAAPNPEWQADITKIENYLQSLKTAQARFVQTANDGTQMVGTFYLSRPGKLRFEYDPPVKDFVVADGRFIYFYDSELGEQTNTTIGSSLADFILRDNIKLSGDIAVTELKRAGGYLQVTLTQSDDPDAGKLLLAFAENKDGSLTLKKWRVIDAQGLITEVELFYLKSGMELDDNLFYYLDPKRSDAAPHYNE